MRIVGGKWAGVALISPAGRVRPTAESLREAWLGALEADLAGARVLDLFAGSGALGLEALSRGAASVDFVESSRSALHALKANVAKLRGRDRTRVFVRDALAFVEPLSPAAYDVTLADPPYTSSLAELLIRRWLRVNFSRVLSVEHALDFKPPGKGRTQRGEDGAFTVYRTRAGGKAGAGPQGGRDGPAAGPER